MTPREASATIEHMLDMDEHARKLGAIADRLVPSKRDALVVAKQALDILATLEENINLNDTVQIENREFEWRATRAQRTWCGSDPTDALGQMCTTLELERALDGDTL